MSKILITGGAGFIGANVARKLADRGEEIVIVDDFNNRYDPRLKEERVQHIIPNLNIVRQDIVDNNAIDNLFSQYKFDQVIHLGAWASVQTSIERPLIYAQTNVTGTVNILEACRQHTIKNIVVASSSSVYGGITEVPFREDMSIMNPISPYAATKGATELMCTAWYNLYKIPTTMLRFFTVYGPWGRPEMAYFQFAKAIRTGQPLLMRGKDTGRDFTYIDDIVDGVISALDKPKNLEVYNLSGNDYVPLPRFIKAIETALQKEAIIEEVPLPPGDLPKTWGDISKAKQDLDYNPKISIEDGIKHFIDWYIDWYVPNFEK